MNKSKVKAILLQSLLPENNQFERLAQGIHPQTMLGKHWLQMIESLGSVQREVKDFSGQYVDSTQPKLYTKEAEETLVQIQTLLSKIYPAIRTMDGIQHRDMHS